MTGVTVSVAHTDDLTDEGVRRATFTSIESCGLSMTNDVRTVCLKVNLRYYWDSSTGETTDPRVVSAVIDYIRERYGRDIDIMIAEADASAMRTNYAFRMLGYEKLSQTKGVRLVNLSRCERVEKRTVVKGREFILPVARPTLDADLLINVPKLRTHRLTTVSCGLKNMFGAIAEPRKIAYHAHLNEVIVAVNKILKPHLTVIDGFVALGKWPVKMGLVLASTDRLAADYIAAKVMGYNPDTITHLMLAEKEGVGTCRYIQISGVEDLAPFSSRFPRENYSILNLAWELKLAALGAYLKLTGDTRPPVLDRKRRR